MHADSQLLDGSPNHTPHRLFSASIGCSLPNTYTGGNLVFLNTANNNTNNSNSIKEKEISSYQLHVGEGLVFSSGNENIHLVSPVLTGQRYQLLLWFIDSKQSVLSTRKQSIQTIKNWLNFYKLVQLDRFYKEWLTHGLLDIIQPSNSIKDARYYFLLKDVNTLTRIGLSKIEIRKFSNSLNKHKLQKQKQSGTVEL